MLMRAFQEEVQHVVHLCHSPKQKMLLLQAPGHTWCKTSTVFGEKDHPRPFSEQAVETCKAECLHTGLYTCNKTVFTLSCLLMTNNYIHTPSTQDEAIELCLFLRACIHREPVGHVLLALQQQKGITGSICRLWTSLFSQLCSMLYLCICTTTCKRNWEREEKKQLK